MLVFGYFLHHYFPNENLLATVLSMGVKSIAKPGMVYFMQPAAVMNIYR